MRQIETVARFKKVTPSILRDNIRNLYPGGLFDKVIGAKYEKYEDVIDPEFSLPQASTNHAAGYDFYFPLKEEITIYPHDTKIIPTGVRCEFLDPSYFLAIFVRSSMGIKHGIQLANQTGIIDADYYESENEGHIMAALYNNSDYEFTLKPGDRFIQGIFIPYGLSENGNDKRVQRTGGIGSTGV